MVKSVKPTASRRVRSLAWGKFRLPRPGPCAKKRWRTSFDGISTPSLPIRLSRLRCADTGQPPGCHYEDANHKNDSSYPARGPNFELGRVSRIIDEFNHTWVFLNLCGSFAVNDNAAMGRACEPKRNGHPAQGQSSGRRAPIMSAELPPLQDQLMAFVPIADGCHGEASAEPLAMRISKVRTTNLHLPTASISVWLLPKHRPRWR